MAHLSPSELILNSDGSIYHLNLKPEHIAQTIITVGDPERVAKVSAYFDHIEHQIQKREFLTHTGWYKGTRLSVISTGIGTDNIDIVLNELDALVNIDFSTRQIKEQLTSLHLIRIGTSGALQTDIPLDSFIVSEVAIGFDNLLHFYESDAIQFPQITEALTEYLSWNPSTSAPYVVTFDKKLGRHMQSTATQKGFTITNPGFYAPQNRTLRLTVKDPDLQTKLMSFAYADKKITNLEMETAGLYGLAKLLGHKAVSMNAILANRATRTFSQNPEDTIDRLIQYTLDKIVSYHP